MKMRVAVFAKGLPQKQIKEMTEYVKCRWNFSGHYSEEEKLVEDAGSRVVEKHGDGFDVIKEGKFSHVLVFDSYCLNEETLKELHDFFGIEVLNFKSLKKREKYLKENKETDEVEVNVEDEGEYKRVEPL